MKKIIASLLTLLTLAIMLSNNVSAQQGLVSYWPGDGNANGVARSNNATTPGGAAYAPGMNASSASRNAFG